MNNDIRKTQANPIKIKNKNSPPYSSLIDSKGFHILIADTPIIKYEGSIKDKPIITGCKMCFREV